MIIIEAAPEEEEKDKEKDKDHSLAHHSFLYCILFLFYVVLTIGSAFAATRPSNFSIDLKPSLVLQKYDFQVSRFLIKVLY